MSMTGETVQYVCLHTHGTVLCVKKTLISNCENNSLAISAISISYSDPLFHTMPHNASCCCSLHCVTFSCKHTGRLGSTGSCFQTWHATFLLLLCFHQSHTRSLSLLFLMNSPNYCCQTTCAEWCRGMMSWLCKLLSLLTRNARQLALPCRATLALSAGRLEKIRNQQHLRNRKIGYITKQSRLCWARAVIMLRGVCVRCTWQPQ